MPAMSVRFVVGATLPPSTSALISVASSGVQRVLPEQHGVDFGRGAAVEVLVLDRDQPLAEERVALAADLDEVRACSRRRRGPRILTRRRLVVAYTPTICWSPPISATGMFSAMVWTLKPPWESTACPGRAASAGRRSPGCRRRSRRRAGRRRPGSRPRARRSSAPCSRRARARRRRHPCAGFSPSSLRLYNGVALPWLFGGTMPRPSGVVQRPVR